MEKETRELELKYEKSFNALDKKRNTIINEENLPDFWLRVLTNHKIFSEFITNDDKLVLKYLKNISHEKLQQENVIHIFICSNF